MLADPLTLEESKLYDGLDDYEAMDMLNRPPGEIKQHDTKFHTKEVLYNPTLQVKLRILCSKKLRVDFKKNKVDYILPQIENAVVHFHGGGFVCHDSYVHQTYTRKWANRIFNGNCVIFSIDYRLAPKYPYPDPVNDCFQAYVWLRTQAKAQLGLDIKHFVMIGDSAGGHLSVSAALLCALRGFQMPDSVFA